MLQRPLLGGLHLKQGLTNRDRGTMKSLLLIRKRLRVAQSSVLTPKSVFKRQIDENVKRRRQVAYSEIRMQQAQENLAAPAEAVRPKLEPIHQMVGQLFRQEKPLSAAEDQTSCQENDELGRAQARTLLIQRTGQISI